MTNDHDYAADAQLRRKIYDLADALLRNEISPEKKKRLEALIHQDDPTARRHYLQFMHDSLQLRDYAGTLENIAKPIEATPALPIDSSPPAVKPLVEMPPITESPFLMFSKRFINYLLYSILWRPHPVRFAAVVTLLTALFVSMLFVFVPRWQSVQKAGLSGTNDGLFVAKVIQVSPNCQWKERDTGPEPGFHLYIGQALDLDAGLVQIRFHRGSEVILQGPAKFTVDSKNSGTLDLGKLTAKVPKKATGFTLQTPFGTITDLGTAFGVEVAQDGVSLLEVYDGVVEVAPSDSHAAARRVAAGEIVRIEPSWAQPEQAAPEKPELTREMPSYRTFLISTADGGGADTGLDERKPDSMQGTLSQMSVRFKPTPTARNQCGLVRFDLSQVEPGSIVSATLKFVVPRGCSSQDNLGVYAINDNIVGEDDWDEGTICFSTAPGLRYDSDVGTRGLVDAKLTGIAGGPLPFRRRGETVSLRQAMLAKYLNDTLQNDSDKRVSLYLFATIAGGDEMAFATKEATRIFENEPHGAPGRFAPVLKLVLEDSPEQDAQLPKQSEEALTTPAVSAARKSSGE